MSNILIYVIILHPNNHQMAQQVFIYTLYTTNAWRGFAVSVPRCNHDQILVFSLLDP